MKLQFPERPDPNMLGEACRNAAKNWRIWQLDYEHVGDFAQMPVFQELPRFLGFGFDYSTFRLYDRSKIELVFDWFGKVENPTSHKNLHKKFSAFCIRENISSNTKRAQKNHISLVSKLLGMWRPDEFAMWDTYARNGLKLIHDHTRGHCYSQANDSSYSLYCQDFFELATKWDRALFNAMDRRAFSGKYKLARFRILDNYLMCYSKSHPPL